MKAKDYVRSKLPKSRSEMHKTTGGERYYLIRDGNAFMYLASGKTESKAWTNAKRLLLSEIYQQKKKEAQNANL